MERLIPNLRVAGSNPAGVTIKTRCYIALTFYSFSPSKHIVSTLIYFAPHRPAHRG